MAHYANNPAARHWRALPKIVVHLKVIKRVGSFFRWIEALKPSLLADADHADRCNGRCSALDVAAMLEDATKSTRSTTQYCATLSTSDAEYVPMAQGAKTVLAIEEVLDCVQPRLISSMQCTRTTRGPIRGLKLHRVLIIASTLVCAFTSWMDCEVAEGSDSQCSLC